MKAQGFAEPLLTELLPRITHRFGNAVGEEDQSVSRRKLLFLDGAIPFLEKTQHGRRGMQSFHLLIAMKEKRGEVATIRVAQSSCLIVILREEERSIVAISRVCVKQLIDGSQELLRLIGSNRALAAEV